MNEAFVTLNELLRHRATHQADRPAFTFLLDGLQEQETWTYADLDAQARIVATRLRELAAEGERALLLFPAGLEVLAALFGCLYAGVVAIPAPPPHAGRLKRSLPRLQAIAGDAQASLVLSTPQMIHQFNSESSALGDLASLRWLPVEAASPEPSARWQDSGVTSETLAYLQYTSGSTATPKGVMIRHRHLLEQCEKTSVHCGYTPHSVTATWMPYYHDYGLVQGMLHPLYNGTPCYMMSPYSFVKRPVRWLQAISRYRVTHSQGPNFAFDQCVRRVSDSHLDGLDLSCWKAAGNAAEPINYRVMEAFGDMFQECGFAWNSFCPGYGLAEATLMVSSSGTGAEPVFCHVSASALERGRIEVVDEPGRGVRTIVGCGRLAPQTEVAIVDPESRTRCAPDRVGEIWVASPTVGAGYWNRPRETDETFHARVAGTGEGPYLRTGDLGFLRDDELYVTGRHKDLIIIRGMNYSPQDIEWSAQASHSALRPENGAAFSVEVDGEERLVIVQEIERRQHRTLDVDRALANIRRAAANDHDLEAYAVVLLKAGNLPKTTSGKIQRQACRQLYLSGELEAVGSWTDSVPRAATWRRAAPMPGKHSLDEIRHWLIGNLAEVLRESPDRIDPTQPLAYWGIGSLRAVQLVGELEAWLGRPLPETLAYDHPSLEAMARFLASGASRQRSGGQQSVSNEPVAIVGMGCRFPGADTPAAFWELLADGVDAVRPTPGWRRDPDATQAAPPASSGTRWGGYLDDIDRFDAEFFGISPREARLLDPQQRLLLEVTWTALEHAAIAPGDLAGTRTGVFVGISGLDYARLQIARRIATDAYAMTGNTQSVAANRISYLLDLWGPSWAVDTACSSSLVAVHQACRSLSGGECDLAIVGAVNLVLDPSVTVALSQAQMMSSVGRCQAFSAEADGYVRSEGCGVVVLKRLSDARRNRDRLMALIRGTAVNQDGRSNGLTAPSTSAQAAVIREALADAGIAPCDINYVEAHGTGTPLGDPIEVRALAQVFAEGRSKDQPLLIGSTKSNIGHLEAAAGMAGLIKLVLSLQHGEIPPHLHYRRPNPRIPWSELPFRVPTRRTPWAASTDAPRRGGVSSFGFSGTNAHVVVEDASRPPVDRSDVDRPLHILTLSAKSEEALKPLREAYIRRLGESSGDSLADICHTANTGRTAFRHRLAVVGESTTHVRELLQQADDGKSADLMVSGSAPSRERRVAFVFASEQAAYPGMGRQLYETQPTFRRCMDRCDEILDGRLQQPLLGTLGGDESDRSLRGAGAAGPALFAVQYACAELWKSWGLRPALLLGDGVGLWVAACQADVLPLEEALPLVARKGGATHDTLAKTLRSRSHVTAQARLVCATCGEVIAPPAAEADASLPRGGDVETGGNVVEILLRDGCDAWIEVGPARGSLAGWDQPASQKNVVVATGFTAGGSEWLPLLQSLARFYVSGVPVNWRGFDQDYSRNRVELPTYPFQRKRYWLDDAPVASELSRSCASPQKDKKLRSMTLAELERMSESEAEALLIQHLDNVE